MVRMKGSVGIDLEDPWLCHGCVSTAGTVIVKYRMNLCIVNQINIHDDGGIGIKLTAPIRL
jgi:hypothetical protein